MTFFNRTIANRPDSEVDSMFLEGERKNIEYKLEYSKTILKTVCAFANFHDGIIVLGIRDDGAIIGVDKIDEIKLNIENSINDAIIPKPFYEFEIQRVEALKLLIVKVYKGDHTLYTYQNKAYMRRDTSTVQLVAFSDSTVNRIKDKILIESCSLLKQFDECMNFYKKHVNIGEVIESAYRKTVEDVPIIAYREAVANMLVHRDYSVAIDARIEIFSDRIEIVSPGGLPIGLLNVEFVEGRISKARNRKIADVF